MLFNSMTFAVFLLAVFILLSDSDGFSFWRQAMPFT